MKQIARILTVSIFFLLIIILISLSNKIYPFSDSNDDPFNIDEDDEIMDLNDNNNSNINDPDSIPIKKKGNDSMNNENETSEIKLYYSDYCTNPDYPEEGPSVIEEDFDLEDYSSENIMSTDYMIFTFNFLDDHYNKRNVDESGDYFRITLLCDNITGGEIFNYSDTTFKGGGEFSIELNCDNNGEGIYYDTIWTLRVEILNCGNYSRYLNLGIITEPDMGNSWEATFDYIVSH